MLNKLVEKYCSEQGRIGAGEPQLLGMFLAKGGSVQCSTFHDVKLSKRKVYDI